ncbi:hypothetical protein GCK72_015632 [Caenorhabditis remanei]|uniref:DUF7154 domain-containing protein n=1 Tax=Caenorhabditis remanei TaxID=31234 RepID=A0A6A5GX28_CAERE|nr:hypothetical protein GCK72_015632 [Caenorhabditis remanei]KAF1759171.1 hypothetical protein GCK72_015632 [Caenorhabditis remanei]
MVYNGYLYTTLANVRFDTRQEEEIEYHSEKKSFNDSLWTHKPDPSIGYGDKTTESNLYNVLKKFLNNGKVSLCGAHVFITVKRYPNESDVFDIISQLRANHVMVNIAVDSIPSGGTNSASLYEMSYQTNGICAFATGSDLYRTFERLTWILIFPYQFLAQNFLVSGSGRIEIPVFTTPVPPGYDDWCLVELSIQNHTLDNSFVLLNYTIASTDGSWAYALPSQNSSYFFGTARTIQLALKGSLTYKWTVDYYYNTVEPQIIQLRMYSEYYHDFLPLPDF